MENDCLGILHREFSSELFIMKLIGEGATSFVYLAKTSENKEYALKLYTSQEAFTNETSILKELTSCKNIVKLISCGKGTLERGCSIYSFDLFSHFGNQTVNYGLFEYLSNGELFNYVLLIKKRFSEEISQKIFFDIVKAVEECHKNGITHGDVKLENVLLSSGFGLKLIDFGFAKKIEKGLISEVTGTQFYAAPENFQYTSKSYDGTASDVFSLGVVLFVLVMGFYPFEKPNIMDHRYKYIYKKDFSNFWKKCEKILPEISNAISNEFKELFQKMICYNPKDRITIKDIKSHPWLLGVSGNNSSNNNNSSNQLGNSNSSSNKTNYGNSKKHLNKSLRPKDNNQRDNNSIFSNNNNKKNKSLGGVSDSNNSKEEKSKIIFSNANSGSINFFSSPLEKDKDKENETKNKNNNYNNENININNKTESPKNKDNESKYIKELMSRKIDIDEILNNREF